MKSRLFLNTISSLGLQVTNIICGFVLPRLILGTYGSEVNGLVNSITYFLQFIAFLELGMGAVVQSALYKPLANKAIDKINEIVTSASLFFKRLAQILLAYVIGLIFVYPYFVNEGFDWLYISTLIAVISISSFAQYYFGVVDRLLLTADQKGYIQYSAQIVTLLGNTILCYILIKAGANIHTVKLTTSLIFLIRPWVLRWYVNKYYAVDRNAKYDIEPLDQKWNGVAQHVACVILELIGVWVLTIFASLSEVSIYTVYYLVTSGVRALIYAATGGFEPLIGRLWASRNIDELNKVFGWFEWIVHVMTSLIFGCTMVLIIPFVSVYTYGVDDADYIQPVFSLILVLATAFRCYRLPYNSMILAGNHYRQTQSNYIVASIINIVVSVIAVDRFGLAGVAAGSFCALFYQTVWMAYYNAKSLLRWSMNMFFKHIAIDSVILILGYMCTNGIRLEEYSYIAWTLCATKVFVIWAIIVLSVNFLFFRDKCVLLYKKISARLNITG